MKQSADSVAVDLPEVAKRLHICVTVKRDRMYEARFRVACLLMRLACKLSNFKLEFRYGNKEGPKAH